MLLIIFTRKKIWVFIYHIAPVRMKFGEAGFLEYWGAPDQALEEHWDTIVDNFMQQCPSNFELNQDYIPVGIVLPFISEHQYNKDEKALQEFYSKQSCFGLVYVEHLIHAYIDSFPAQEKRRKDNFILFEALDDDLNAIAYFWKQKELVIKNFNFPNIGWKSGKNYLMNTLVSQFARDGLLLDEHDEATLSTSLKYPRKGSVVRFQKNNKLKIDVHYEFDEIEFESFFTQNLHELRVYFDALKEINFFIYKIILIGDFFNNFTLLEYFENELKLKQKIFDKDAGSDLKAFRRIAKAAFQNINQRGQLPTASVASEDDEGKQRSEQLKKLRHKRDKILTDIRSSCNQKEKSKKYLDKYSKLGNKAGIPPSIINWAIKDTIDKTTAISSNTEKNRPHEFKEIRPVEETYNSPLLPENLYTNTDIKPTQSIAPDPLPASQRMDFISRKKQFSLFELKRQFDVERIYQQVEFTQFDGFKKGETSRKVFHLINADDANDPNLLDRFKRIYLKESAYYQSVSSIQTIPFGKFYYRDFFEGISFRQYAQKRKFKKRFTLDKLSKDDLKVILLIWKEIDKIEFPWQALNADNILILETRNWKMVKSFDVQLKGCDASAYDRISLINRTHEVLKNEIGVDLYETLREKFKI